MILVDTSVWIDHLRCRDPILAGLLEQNRVTIHSFVIGELACGNLQNRQRLLSLLSFLPRCTPATHEETLFFIDRHRLMGQGIGYMDVCLLAAASLNRVQLS